jgi:hypothetical protein
VLGEPRVPGVWAARGRGTAHTLPGLRRTDRRRVTTLEDRRREAARLLRNTADRVDQLAARSTAGDWRLAGLLASRPEVVAHRPDGSTEHVAEGRSGSAHWIAALSPTVAGPLAAWLRSAASEPSAEAVTFAKALLGRLS